MECWYYSSSSIRIAIYPDENLIQHLIVDAFLCIELKLMLSFLNDYFFLVLFLKKQIFLTLKFNLTIIGYNNELLRSDCPILI